MWVHADLREEGVEMDVKLSSNKPMILFLFQYSTGPF